MTQDRPFLGILLMLGFCLMAPLGDAMAKYLAATLPILTLVTVRFATQSLALIPVVVAMRTPLRFSRRFLAVTLLRTILHCIGITAMFLALKYMPLADAVAIAFVMPFIMLLLGHFVLGEHVGMRRMVACTVGFAGTLMVIQPSFQDVGAVALLPLLVAIVFSLFMLVTRQIAKETDALVLQLVSGWMACGFLAPVIAFMPGGFTMPDGQWLLLIALGLLGTLAHLFMTWSLRFAPTSTLAPMQYLEIPVAALLGLAVFGDFPDGLALAGICVTIGAGLYIIAREHRLQAQ